MRNDENCKITTVHGEDEVPEGFVVARDLDPEPTHSEYGLLMRSPVPKYRVCIKPGSSKMYFHFAESRDWILGWRKFSEENPGATHVQYKDKRIVPEGYVRLADMGVSLSPSDNVAIAGSPVKRIKIVAGRTGVNYYFKKDAIDFLQKRWAEQKKIRQPAKPRQEEDIPFLGDVKNPGDMADKLRSARFAISGGMRRVLDGIESLEQHLRELAAEE